MHIDLGLVRDGITMDTLKNGQIQKFEYSLELVWKFIKAYLKHEKGIDAQGPKDVIRAFGPFRHLSVEDLSLLLEAIDDRTRIAH